MGISLGKLLVNNLSYKKPEKNSNPTLDEFEKLVNTMDGVALDMEELKEQCTPEAIDFYEKFSPKKLYVIKEGAPYRHTVEGSIVIVGGVVEKNDATLYAEVMVVHSPIGYYGYTAPVDPEYLEQISVDDARERFKKVTKASLEENRQETLVRLCGMVTALTESMGMESCCICKKEGRRNVEGRVPYVVLDRLDELIRREVEGEHKKLEKELGEAANAVLVRYGRTQKN